MFRRLRKIRLNERSSGSPCSAAARDPESARAGARHRPGNVTYGAPKELVTNTSIPIPLNSAGAQGQHHCAPG